jgi:hypothetical protein
MENTEKNIEKTWKLWKKDKLKCEKNNGKYRRNQSWIIWNIWKKCQLKCEKIWKIWKKPVELWKDMENTEESQVE